MPLCSLIFSGFISGITNGTSGTILNADELSTTTAPAFTAAGANSLLRAAPALNSAISTPLKLLAVSSSTIYSLPLNSIFLPAAPAARKHFARIERKIPLFENPQKFLSDRTGHTCNCQITTHLNYSIKLLKHSNSQHTAGCICKNPKIDFEIKIITVFQENAICLILYIPPLNSK